MARVLGDSLEKNVFLAFSFLIGESQQVSARKDIGVTLPSLCCPEKTSPGVSSLAHF